MSQAKLPNPGPMADVARDGLRDTLPPGVRIERRADGSVWRIEQLIKPTPKDGKEAVGPDYSEQRVDSKQDLDFIAKGGEPWYMKHLRKGGSK